MFYCKNILCILYLVLFFLIYLFFLAFLLYLLVWGGSVHKQQQPPQYCQGLLQNNWCPAKGPADFMGETGGLKSRGNSPTSCPPNSL